MMRYKAYNKGKSFLFLFFVLCLIFFNFLVAGVFTGCGLDVFYFVPEPVQAGYKPEVDNNLVDKKIFQFDTREGVGTGGFSVTGTDVYYKIYTNKSEWKSESDSLKQMAENNNVNAADKLISTGYGYGYQTLKIAGYNDNVLIPFTGSSKNVKIRLTSYFDMPEYSAKVESNDVNKGVPVRFNGKPFDFARLGERDKPSLGDADIKGSSLPVDNKWYVCLFAVSRGHDAAYTNYYSNIAYLGSVTIDGNSKDN